MDIWMWTELMWNVQHEYKFIDRIRVKAISGKGGDGCMSFDRQPSKPRGPPDGGNGGNGGDVMIVWIFFFWFFLVWQFGVVFIYFV